MGSVQNFGERCPVCGKNAVASDYYYRTGELFCNCMYCGYHHSNRIKYGEDNKPVFELKHSLDLSSGKVLLGASSLESPRKCESDFSDIRAIPEDMTTEGLYEFLNNPPSGVFHAVYLKKEDGTFEQISWRLTDMSISEGKFEARDVVWEVEDAGGYGVLRLTCNGISHIYTLGEGETPENLMKEMTPEQKKNAMGVIFHERGKDPEYIGISAEEWEHMTVENLANK